MSQQFVLVPWVFLALVTEWKCGEPNKGSNVVQCYFSAILGVRDVAGKKKLGCEGRVFLFCQLDRSVGLK